MSLAALRQRLAHVIAPPPVAGGGVRTGIAALDAALSDGGLPCGRLTEIVGARGSGKTTLVRAIVAQALADKRWVAYIDAGRTLAPTDWAPLAETGRLWIVRPPVVAVSASAAPAPAAPIASGAPAGHSRTAGAGRASAAPDTDMEQAAGDDTDASLPVAHGPWCADVLLRSGTFGLVVLDGAGALARGVVVRLTRLARESHAAFVVLRDTGDGGDGRGRSGELVGGAVRLRVRRRPRGRHGGAPGGASEAGVMGGTKRRHPVPTSGRTTVVLDVSVEKGGTHQVVEVGCAIEVARRLCAHPQVPDRRGVAARNRRGERVAPDAPGVRRTAPPPDGAGGRDGATLAHKRRCAEPAIHRDEFLLRR